MLGQDVLLDPSLLKDPRYDYVALGHIHKHQVLHETPPVIYSGSIERIDFGEANETKGFVVAEIGEKETTWEFIKTPTREFREIVLDVREHPDPMPFVRDRLGALKVEGQVVKVILRASVDNEAHLDTREIRRLLGDAAHVAAVVRDVERPARLRLGNAQEISESGPRELLARYFEAKLVPPERRELLLRYAETLFDEESEDE
jgi:exonuclease SbcD